MFLKWIITFIPFFENSGISSYYCGRAQQHSFIGRPQTGNSTFYQDCIPCEADSRNKRTLSVRRCKCFFQRRRTWPPCGPHLKYRSSSFPSCSWASLSFYSRDYSSGSSYNCISWDLLLFCLLLSGWMMDSYIPPDSNYFHDEPYLYHTKPPPALSNRPRTSQATKKSPIDPMIQTSKHSSVQPVSTYCPCSTDFAKRAPPSVPIPLRSLTAFFLWKPSWQHTLYANPF